MRQDTKPQEQAQNVRWDPAKCVSVCLCVCAYMCVCETVGGTLQERGAPFFSPPPSSHHNPPLSLTLPRCFWERERERWREKCVWVFTCVCVCGKADFWWFFLFAFVLFLLTGFAFLLPKQRKRLTLLAQTTPYSFIHFHSGRKACHSDALLLSSSRCLAELWATFWRLSSWNNTASTLCLGNSQTPPSPRSP